VNGGCAHYAARALQILQQSVIGLQQPPEEANTTTCTHEGRNIAVRNEERSKALAGMRDMGREARTGLLIALPKYLVDHREESTLCFSGQFGAHVGTEVPAREDMFRGWYEGSPEQARECQEWKFQGCTGQPTRP
jgi:hypothetical protein